MTGLASIMKRVKGRPVLPRPPMIGWLARTRHGFGRIEGFRRRRRGRWWVFVKVSATGTVWRLAARKVHLL